MFTTINIGVRTGEGGGKGGLQIWGNSVFWAAREIWAKPFFKDVSMFFFFKNCRARRLGYMTVSEMLETMHENGLLMVHILAVILATSCSAERSFSALRTCYELI